MRSAKTDRPRSTVVRRLGAVEFAYSERLLFRSHRRSVDKSSSICKIKSCHVISDVRFSRFGCQIVVCIVLHGDSGEQDRHNAGHLHRFGNEEWQVGENNRSADLAQESEAKREYAAYLVDQMALERKVLEQQRRNAAYKYTQHR